MAHLFDGQREGLTPDDVLDNVTLYWLTNTTILAARLYWESKLAFFAPKGVPTPAAVSAFADELYQAPRSWTEQAYPKVMYYKKHDKGGHFAAWEQPELLAATRAAARGANSSSIVGGLTVASDGTGFTSDGGQLPSKELQHDARLGLLRSRVVEANPGEKRHELVSRSEGILVISLD